MTFDPDRYRHHFDHLDMTEAQKLDFMRSVRGIMESFVDRAFGDAPEQAALASIVQQQNEDRHPVLETNKLDCLPNTFTEFNNVARDEAARKKDQ